MTTSPFELHVISPNYRQVRRRHEGEYGVALYQQPVRSRSRTAQTEEPQLVSRIWGTPFRCTVDRILAALKENGYRGSDLSRNRTAPFHLREESGVRLGLAFLAPQLPGS